MREILTFSSSGGKGNANYCSDNSSRTHQGSDLSVQIPFYAAGVSQSVAKAIIRRACRSWSSQLNHSFSNQEQVGHMGPVLTGLEF